MSLLDGKNRRRVWEGQVNQVVNGGTGGHGGQWTKWSKKHAFGMAGTLLNNDDTGTC